MKKQTQAERNPYPNSDSNKRYYTYDYYLKHTFGAKCARIPLDAGFTCPNIDGKSGYGGCIYCRDGSCMSAGTLAEQYRAGVDAARRKWGKTAAGHGGLKFIPYLQAHTNTYASPETLRAVYREAAAMDSSVMLSIATRADCLSDGALGAIADISNEIPVTVELGLQTVHDETALRINRCHTYEDFLSGYRRLRSAGSGISVGVHIINGLPGEDADMMLETARSLASLEPDMVKIHLLHVLRDTPLAEMYFRGEYEPMTPEEYVSVTVGQLEVLPPDTVIGRISGDAPADVLIAPMWCLKKTAVSNNIDKEMFRRNTWQGRLFHPAGESGGRLR